jgi:hypothetical protein
MDNQLPHAANVDDMDTSKTQQYEPQQTVYGNTINPLQTNSAVDTSIGSESFEEFEEEDLSTPPQSTR